LIAGFDLNSDRINMVVMDEHGRIVDTRTAWFPKVASPGFPRNKARVARLQAFSKLIEYAYYHGVGVAVSRVSIKLSVENSLVHPQPTGRCPGLLRDSC